MNSLTSTTGPRGRLTAWLGAGGRYLDWDDVRRVVGTEAPTAMAWWADLDGLRRGALPTRMPTTTRLWLWTAGEDLWRIVPLERPDAPAAARLARLVPGDDADPAGGAAGPDGDGAVTKVTRSVSCRRLPDVPLERGMRTRVEATGLRVTRVAQADAALAVPLRFMALR